MKLFNRNATKTVYQFTGADGETTVDHRHGILVLAAELRRYAHSSTTLVIDPDTQIEMADLLDAYRNRSLWRRIFD